MTPKKKFLLGTFFVFLFAIACAIVAVCMLLLFSEVYTYIIAAVAAICAIAGFLTGWDHLKLSRQIFCKACGQRLDFDTDVDYDIADVIETDKSVVDVVEFHTECSNCGHEHDFSKKFTVGTVDKNGNSHYKDVDTLIKKMFKTK